MLADNLFYKRAASRAAFSREVGGKRIKWQRVGNEGARGSAEFCKGGKVFAYLCEVGLGAILT